MANMPASVQTERISAPAIKNDCYCSRGRRETKLTGAVGTQASEEFEANVSFDAHRAGVNLEDVCSAFEIWQAELNFTIEASGSHECGVESIRSVSCHEDLLRND